MKQRYDLFAFSLMLFSVALIVAVSIFRSEAKSLYDFIWSWQTLFAGGLAIIAAFIAAHPVRQQFSKMNVQASIMAREVLANRLMMLEARRVRTEATLDKVSMRLSGDIYYADQISLNPHWAFEREREVDEVIKSLRDDQESKADSEWVDTVREKVLKSAVELENCLFAIHAPASGRMDDPEISLSEEEISKIEADSEKAPGRLPDLIAALVREEKALMLAFLEDADKLKKKIRSIDDLIIKDQIEHF
jgi:hypothetical protein